MVYQKKEPPKKSKVHFLSFFFIPPSFLENPIYRNLGCLENASLKCQNMYAL
jgi:hypothetical protein